MTFLFALLLASAHAGDVLFVDLNNSANEAEACKAGVQAKNPNEHFEKFGKSDLAKYSRSGEMDADALNRFVAAKERAGRKFDCVVISGHDGSGHFFGENGDLTAGQAASLVARSRLKDSLTSMALWGCYTANANAAENYWMQKISPNIKSTIGFTLQSPSNRRPENFALLQDYCMKREQIANAETKAEMSNQFYHLAGINKMNAAVCYKEGVCANEYANPGEKGNCFHSYEELQQRCSKFDPSRKLLATYKAYFEASDPAYANPPPDGEDEYVTEGTYDPSTKGALRNYYNQLHLWYHCSYDLYKHTGYSMPMPATVIRLTKFETVKRNFAALHQKELEQYNALLAQMGLGQLALDPANMSRKDIVERMRKAIAKLEGLSDASSGKVNGVDPYKLLIMAYGFDNSLRTLKTNCLPFSYVHENAGEHSDCIAQYGEDPKWPKR